MSDAALLNLEARFHAIHDRWDAATAKTARLERLFDRFKGRIATVEAAEAEEAGAIDLTFERIMATRATTIAGLIVKVRVRERWNTDDRESEVTILNSLVADIKAIAEEQP